jgi:hypothetical protein
MKTPIPSQTSQKLPSKAQLLGEMARRLSAYKTAGRIVAHYRIGWAGKN